MLKGLNTVDVPAGAFSVVENATPIAGYTTTYSGCSGTILNDETKTCTITNTDQAAHLIINKVVTNDNGGSLTAANFSGTVSGVTASGGQTWSGASTNLTLTTVGSYSVAENAHPGYDATFSADCTRHDCAGRDQDLHRDQRRSAGASDHQQGSGQQQRRLPDGGGLLGHGQRRDVGGRATRGRAPRRT